MIMTTTSYKWQQLHIKNILTFGLKTKSVFEIWKYDNTTRVFQKLLKSLDKTLKERRSVLVLATAPFQSNGAI